MNTIDPRKLNRPVREPVSSRAATMMRPAKKVSKERLASGVLQRRSRSRQRDELLGLLSRSAMKYPKVNGITISM